MWFWWFVPKNIDYSILQRGTQHTILFNKNFWWIFWSKISQKVSVSAHRYIFDRRYFFWYFLVIIWYNISKFGNLSTIFALISCNFGYFYQKTLITVYCKGALKIPFYSTKISDGFFGQKFAKKYQYRHDDTFSDTVSVSVLIHFVEKYLYRHIDTF